MKTLVFDTCLDKMYVALADEDKILDSKIVCNKDNKYHSAFLISTVKNMLKNNNLTPKDIDGLGTNIGPGSFTGIRACITVARIMAQQLNIPVAGISSLEILSKINSSADATAVALDARKNSAYLYVNGALYEDAVLLDEVKNKTAGCKLITDDKLQPVLGGISYQQGEYNLGEILAELAYKKLKSNKCDWKDLKPLYIQPPPVS